MTTTPVGTRRVPDARSDILGPTLIIIISIAGVGVLYKLTASLPVTAIAAILAGVLGTVAQAGRVHHHLVRHWD